MAEAARAVYDERIMAGMPALAKLADKPAQQDAVAFRALAACFWGGTAEDAGRVARFAGRAGEPDYTRAFALHLLSDWANPPRRDPVMGVTMTPGAMALTRMPCGASSLASALVSWTTPPLDAV